MSAIKLPTMFCVAFPICRVGFFRSLEWENVFPSFHAKHPLAESKLKGAKVSVTIEYNQNLRFNPGVGAAISNLIIFESAV
jgi:hypothetical protein